jgi:hypothetical protein
MPLLTNNTIPPGGWIYDQMKDGVLFKKMVSHGTYIDFCKDVLSLRVGNNLPGATMAQVDADVQSFTCTRLGNDPRWCANGSGPVTQPTADTFYAVQPGGGCGGCGGSKVQ